MNGNKEQTRKAIFGKLKTLRRRLTAQGVPCSYSRSVLSHANEVRSFQVTFQPNGDTSLTPRISVRNGEATEEFDATSFEQGLARVRELFKVQ